MTSSTAYKISLRITHPDIDSERISRELGLRPKISYNVGENKFTPRGTEVPGIRKNSFWCHELTITDQSIEDVISRATRELSDKKKFLRSIAMTGGSVEFFVGWFSNGNSGFSLTSNILGELADVGIGLSLDIYPTGNT